MKPVRLDAAIHEQLRVQAFAQRSSITRVANDLLRVAIPMAEAGLFNRPLHELQAALERLAQEETDRA